MKKTTRTAPPTESEVVELAETITADLRKQGLAVKCRSDRQRFHADDAAYKLILDTLAAHFHLDVETWAQAEFEKIDRLNNPHDYPNTQKSTT